MISIISCLLGGLLVGRYFRDQSWLISLSAPTLRWAVYLLLFLMGLQIGSNGMLQERWSQLGLTTLVLTFAGILGSCLLAYGWYRLAKKHHHLPDEA